MNKKSYHMLFNRFLKLQCTILCFGLLFGCTSSESSQKEIVENNSFIRNILKVNDEMGNIWEGFECINEFPIFILTDSDEGIFLNPPQSQLKLSSKIGEISGFPLYENKELLSFSRSKLLGDSFFNLTFYEGFELFVYDISKEPFDNFYNNYKNRNNLFHESIFFHELFHIYQHKNQNQFFTNDFVQDFLNYPINNESLPLLMLLFNVMSDAYHLTEPNQKEAYLKYYISIMTEINTIDKTPNNLARNHGFFQEKFEGTARYIEVFATLDALENNTTDDPTHGYADFIDDISSSFQVREIYAQRVFYHSGAGAIFLLKELGYSNIEADLLIPTNTIYDLVRKNIILDNDELLNNLEEIKTIYNWEDLVVRSSELLDLP